MNEIINNQIKSVDLKFKEQVDFLITRFNNRGIVVPDAEQMGYLATNILNSFAVIYGMTDWKIMYDNMGRSLFARCYHKLKIITLNHDLIGYVELDDWVETILHELAHAKTDTKHTKKWREFYIQIGGNGNAHAKRSAIPNIYKYKLTCPECGKVAYMHKKGKDRSCGKCSGGKYNPKYELEWTLNEYYQKKLTA